MNQLLTGFAIWLGKLNGVVYQKLCFFINLEWSLIMGLDSYMYIFIVFLFVNSKISPLTLSNIILTFNDP